MKMNAYLLYFMIGTFVKAYEGDGTFYGAGGHGAEGACMLQPGFNNVAITAAMNREQYAGGASCGKCVLITGKGEGSGMTPIIGPILATIDNECPECKFGDVDLGLSGDGRWRITWDFVECPHNKPNLRQGN